MRYCFIFSFLFLMTFHLQSAVVTNSAALEIQKGELLLRNKLDDPEWKSAPLSLQLYDGKSKKMLRLQNRKFTEKNGIITAEYTFPGCRITLRFSARNRIISGQGTLANTGKVQLWPELTFSAALLDTPLYFWGGDSVAVKTGSKMLTRSGIKGVALKHIASTLQPFPLAAAAGKRHSLFLGHKVYDPVSYNRSVWDPRKKILHFSQRFVADPGQQLSFTLTAGAAQTTYGIPEGIIQQYYDSLPECWAVNGGQENPYIWGNQAHYLYWWGTPDFELARRLYITMEWAYCPYKRSGDLYCRPELWDYKPLLPYRRTPRMGGVQLDFGKLTREQFVKLRRERFLKYGRRCGWMFYNSGGGLIGEYDLITKRYPDAVNDHDPKADTVIWNGRWSTWHDKEIRAFAYHTSFAKVLHEDMAALTGELKLPGFALDCGSGGFFYRGPVINKAVPGRAWDEKGIFIDQSVAINDVIDKIRKIKSDIPLTCWVNGTLKGDYLLLERSYVDRGELSRMLPMYRWWIGPRPGSVHKHGYLYPNLVPAWRQQTKEEMMETLGKLSDYVLLNQFKYGLNNTHTVMWGAPKIVYAQPECHELQRAGWQIEVPVKLSEKLYCPYLARYGRDENTFLFFGNSSEEDSSGSVTVDSRSLAGNRPHIQLFVRKMRSGARSINTVENGSVTLEMLLPSRTPVLFETACSILTPPSAFKAEVQSLKTLDVHSFEIKLTAPEAFSTALAVRGIHDFKLEKIMVDGKKVSFFPADRNYRTRTLRIQKDSVIKIFYRSRYFKLTDRDMDLFRFTDKNGKISFSVFAPGAAGEFASRFDEYFAYCSKNRMIRPGVVKVPRSTASGKNTITLRMEKKLPQQIFTDKSGGITVTAPDAMKMELLLKKLFYRMDKRYPSAIAMPRSGTMGFYKAQVTHFKAAGMLLPYKPFFE